MDIDLLYLLFDRHSSASGFIYVRGDQRLSERPDLNAFLLLDKLVPGKGDILAAAEHDQVWLSVTLEELAASAINEDDILTLCRCGVHLGASTESLYMFV